jgi:hypothetical protein
VLAAIRRITLRLRLSLFTSTRQYLAVADASRELLRDHGAGAMTEARQRAAAADKARERLFWTYVEADLELRGASTLRAEPSAGE